MALTHPGRRWLCTHSLFTEAACKVQLWLPVFDDAFNVIARRWSTSSNRALDLLAGRPWPKAAHSQKGVRMNGWIMNGW